MLGILYRYYSAISEHFNISSRRCRIPHGVGRGACAALASDVSHQCRVRHHSRRWSPAYGWRVRAGDTSTGT